ncbi:hypothetical protein D5E72_20485 [Vibrio parahaemolyticus]|nr:hypothetical protein D5E73_22000 [Vibrio parahaemolyticus]TBT72809.1 hypothetical protein D5E72_20485 [Vibrio parahaemolyticus]
MNVFQRCTSLRKKSDNKKRCH